MAHPAAPRMLLWLWLVFVTALVVAIALLIGPMSGTSSTSTQRTSRRISRPPSPPVSLPLLGLTGNDNHSAVVDRPPANPAAVVADPPAAVVADPPAAVVDLAPRPAYVVLTATPPYGSTARCETVKLWIDFHLPQGWDEIALFVTENVTSSPLIACMEALVRQHQATRHPTAITLAWMPTPLTDTSFRGQFSYGEIKTLQNTHTQLVVGNLTATWVAIIDFDEFFWWANSRAIPSAHAFLSLYVKWGVLTFGKYFYSKAACLPPRDERDAQQTPQRQLLVERMVFRERVPYCKSPSRPCEEKAKVCTTFLGRRKFAVQPRYVRVSWDDTHWGGKSSSTLPVKDFSTDVAHLKEWRKLLVIDHAQSCCTRTISHPSSTVPHDMKDLAIAPTCGAKTLVADVDMNDGISAFLANMKHRERYS